MRLVFPRNWRRDVKLLLFSFMAIDSFFDLRAYLITPVRDSRSFVAETSAFLSAAASQQQPTRCLKLRRLATLLLPAEFEWRRMIRTHQIHLSLPRHLPFQPECPVTRIDQQTAERLILKVLR